MFTVNLPDIKARQAELHREAAEYRLMLSQKKPRQWTAVLASAFGKLLVTSGQQLINRYQLAH